MKIISDRVSLESIERHMRFVAFRGNHLYSHPLLSRSYGCVTFDLRQLSFYLSVLRVCDDVRKGDLIKEVYRVLLTLGRFSGYSITENVSLDPVLARFTEDYCVKYLQTQFSELEENELMTYLRYEAVDAMNEVELLKFSEDFIVLLSGEISGVLSGEDIVEGTETIEGSVVRSTGGRSSDTREYYKRIKSEEFHSPHFKILNDYALCKEHNVSSNFICFLVFIAALIDIVFNRFVDITTFVKTMK